MVNETDRANTMSEISQFSNKPNTTAMAQQLMRAKIKENSSYIDMVESSPTIMDFGR